MTSPVTCVPKNWLMMSQILVLIVIMIFVIPALKKKLWVIEILSMIKSNKEDLSMKKMVLVDQMVRVI